MTIYNIYRKKFTCNFSLLRNSRAFDDDIFIVSFWSVSFVEWRIRKLEGMVDEA